MADTRDARAGMSAERCRSSAELFEKMAGGITVDARDPANDNPAGWLEALYRSELALAARALRLLAALSEPSKAVVEAVGAACARFDGETYDDWGDGSRRFADVYLELARAAIAAMLAAAEKEVK